MKIIALKCPQCGAHLESNQTFCEHCGTTVRLAEDKLNFIGSGIACPQCKAPNQIGDKHCGSCGESLITICPVANCRTENSIWRIFCRKCGRNILDCHIEILENDQEDLKEKIYYHVDEIKRIQNELPRSKNREVSIKVIIGIVGGIISLFFLSIKDNGWIGTLIAIFITALIVLNYHSSEDYNLFNSLALHKEDLERLQEKYEINEAKLARIKLQTLNKTIA